jgi:hypothetical protein
MLNNSVLEYFSLMLKRFNNYNFFIPDFVWDPNFSVEIARNREDLEAVFKLQHETYVGRGLIKPHPSGLRCTVYHFLPQTSHVVVKYKKSVVASMTLIADSSLGIPGDKYFSDEMTEMRKKGHKIVELSSFAVDRAFKISSKVMMHLLMKYSLNYVRRFMDCSQIVVNVHPSMANMYSTSWCFDKQSEVIKFHSSKSAYTMLLTHTLEKSFPRHFVKSFPSNELSRNAAKFVEATDNRFIYPYMAEGQVVHPVMSPELLEYFFIQKTNLYEELDLNTRQVFLEMYLQFFGEAEIERFLNLERDLTLKEFRIPVSTKVAIKVGPQFYVGKIRDLTSSGCFIEVPQEIRDPGNSLALTFKLGESQVHVQAKASWRNLNQQLRYGHGYGVRFDNQIHELRTELKSWLPTRRAA